MALVDGTNCGFVLSAPVADPAATSNQIDTKSQACKFVAPAGATKVVEMGWWCDNATEAATTELGIYDHNAGTNLPDNRLGVASFAKGTTAGWKTAVVDIDVVAGTTYWLAVQLDDTATNTNYNVVSNAAYKRSDKDSSTSLTNPWGAQTWGDAYLIGVYAVYTSGPDFTKASINVGDVFKSGAGMSINIGDSFKEVAAMSINVDDAWKTVF